jgi:leader peptidase (prepilin peptidase) / N-methyltransferase
MDAIAQQLMFGIVGAVVGVWLFDIITILGSVMMGQPAMGGGDAKLAAMIGAWLGWQQVLVSSFLACAVGAFIGGGAIALKLMSRRQPMPFGPYLALGGVITALWGGQLIDFYHQFFFPTL